MSFIYVPPTASVGQSNLTAATALTAGQAVAVNSSGQAAAVSGYAQGPGNVSLVTNSGNTTQATWGTASAYDTVNQRLVVFYQKPTTGDYYCKVGTLTSGTWTFGTEVLVIANTGGTTCNSDPFAIYNVAAGKIMFMTYYNNTSISLIAGTVSGSTITFGAINTYTSVLVYNGAALVYDDKTGQALIGFTNQAGPNYTQAAVLSLSGTTITVNTPVGLNTVSYSYSWAAGNGYIISFRAKGTIPTGWAGCALEISGTTLINASGEVLVVGRVMGTYNQCYIAATKTYEYVTAQSAGSLYIETVTYTTAGGFNSAEVVVTTTGQYNVSTYSYPITISYDSSTNYIAMTWTPAAAGSTMQTSLYTISGTTLTSVSTFNALTTTTKMDRNQTISLNNGTLIYTYRDTSTGYTYSNPIYETTNTNYTGFIGFSSAAYGIGATATILTDGAITTSQSGLTPGLKYYVQTDGTLTTTVGSNQFAGHALSSTSLLILG
jgi:hypothetical protein